VIPHVRFGCSERVILALLPCGFVASQPLPKCAISIEGAAKRLLGAKVLAASDEAIVPAEYLKRTGIEPDIDLFSFGWHTLFGNEGHGLPFLLLSDL
jgi:hypothetical protein